MNTMNTMIILANGILNWTKSNKPIVIALVVFVIIVYLFDIPVKKSVETVYLGDNYHEAKVDKKLVQPEYQVKVKKAKKMKAEIESMTKSIKSDATQSQYGKSFIDVEDMRDQKTVKYERYYKSNRKYLSDSDLPAKLKYN